MALRKRRRRDHKNTFSAQRLLDARLMACEPDYMYSDEEDGGGQPSDMHGAPSAQPRRVNFEMEFVHVERA